MKEFNLGFGSDHVALKYQVLLSRGFLAVLVFLLMLCECSVIVKVMIAPVETFGSWYCTGIFDIFSVVLEPSVKLCF